MSEMVERCKQALLNVVDEQVYPGALSESYHQSLLDDEVRAVIRALREPTEAMAIAGQRLINAICNLGEKPNSRDVWRAMIDAAMAEDQKEPPEAA